MDEPTRRRAAERAKIWALAEPTWEAALPHVRQLENVTIEALLVVPDELRLGFCREMVKWITREFGTAMDEKLAELGVL